VLDDVENLLACDRAINILKAALWHNDNNTKVRTVGYKTTAKALNEYPESFEFSGKVIFLVNNINNSKNCESFKALVSRCLTYEIKYTMGQLFDMSVDILHTKYKNNKITFTELEKCQNIIKKHINFDFNFRLLDRLVEFVKLDFDMSEQLYKSTLPQSTFNEFEIIEKCLILSSNAKVQYSEYYQNTGRSRATFHRKKSEYLNLKRAGYF
jgi:hypothetical protein